MGLIAPSILSADFANLGEDVSIIEKYGADWVHIDVMDGNYVPNITFGIPVVKAIRKYSKLPFDVHLMIEKPSRYFKDFKESGADYISFHYEAETHVDRAVQLLKELEVKAGIALNPGTPVSILKDIIGELDYVLLMSVNPGFGGQKFISYTLDKIKELREMIKSTGKDIIIQIDGGVDKSNIGMLKELGVESFVAGSAVFKERKIEENIKALREALK